MKSIYEIVIVGAGPAGSYLALKLAEAGRECLIFDGSHPREKPCGGGISSAALKRYPFLEELSSEGFESEKFLFISPKGRQLFFKGEKQLNVSRKILDQFILNKAILKGAKHYKERIENVLKDNNFWLLKTTQREIKSRIIIGADGVSSLVRKKTVGAFKKNELYPSRGMFLEGRKYDYNLIKFIYGLKGYFWGFQQKDQISVGLGGILKKYPFDILCNLAEEFYPNLKILSDYGAATPSSRGNPDFYDKPTAGQDWLLIGDAAGHTDPYTGEGILYALWGAELASGALLKNSPAIYDQLWRKSYGKKFLGRAKFFNTFYNSRFLEDSINISIKSKVIAKYFYGLAIPASKQGLISRIFKVMLKRILEILYSSS